MADKKVSELDAIIGTDTAADDLFLIVDTSGTVTKKITRAELNNAIEQDVLENISITNLTSDLSTNGNDINFGDNDKAVFGASSDLQIFHDGSNSIVKDAGTGILKIQGSGQVTIEDTAGNVGAAFNANTDVALKYAGSNKLVTTSTGIDVTGRITTDGITSSGTYVVESTSYFVGNAAQGYRFNNAADTTNLLVIKDSGNVGIGTSSPSARLEVHGASGGIAAELQPNANNDIVLNIRNATANQVGYIQAHSDSISIDGDFTKFTTSGSERMRITSGGLVGIGTAAPATAGVGLHVQTSSTSISDTVTADVQAIFERNGNAGIAIVSGAGSNGTLKFGAPGDLDGGRIVYSQSADSMRFLTADNERLRIDSSGNVGIGTASPSARLHLKTPAGDNCDLFIEDSTFSPNIRMYSGGTNINSSIFYGAGAGSSNLLFRQTTTGAGITGSNTERMRIDNSGNLLVGKTAEGVGNIGFQARPDGFFSGTRDNSTVAYLQRQTSDGEILRFQKGNSTVGSIGTRSGHPSFGNGDTGIELNDFVEAVQPFNTSTNSTRDNAIDIGSSSVRFDDIFATNGTIQTSDANEKNTITDSDLGLDFINRLEPKSYVFNGKTRTHYGLIAQDVETVLGDISKPTSGFAGFIKSDISEEQDGSEYRYGLRYTEFVGPLIKALQEADAKIEALEARIAALEGA